jgi:hypothetical protein
MTETQTPELVPVRHSDPSKVVHLGYPSKWPAHVVTACNGRTMAGFVFAGATVTCKRCAAKAVK